MLKKTLFGILAAFLLLSCGTLDELQKQLEGSGFGDYNPLGTPTGEVTLAPGQPTRTPVNPTSTATPVYLTVSGVWRCRAEPNIISDTLVFLHDGEIVKLISSDSNWNKVAAGNAICYVNVEAFK